MPLRRPDGVVQTELGNTARKKRRRTRRSAIMGGIHQSLSRTAAALGLASPGVAPGAIVLLRVVFRIEQRAALPNPSADRRDRPRPRGAALARPAASQNAAGDMTQLVEAVLAATAPVVLIDALPGTGKSTLLRAIAERTGTPVSQRNARSDPPDAGTGDAPTRLIDFPSDAMLEIDPDGPRLIVAAAAHQIVDHSRWRLYGWLSEFDNRAMFLDAQADPSFTDSAGWPALAAHFAENPDGHVTAVAFLRETVLPRLLGPRLRVLQALDQSRSGLPNTGLRPEDRAALRWLRPLTVCDREGRWKLRSEGFAGLLRQAFRDRPLSAEVGLLLEHAGDTAAAVVGTLAAGHRRRAVEIVGRAGGVMLGHIHGPEEARAVLNAFGEDPHPTIVALRIMTAMKAGHSGHAVNLLDAAIRALFRRQSDRADPHPCRQHGLSGGDRAAAQRQS